MFTVLCSRDAILFYWIGYSNNISGQVDPVTDVGFYKWSKWHNWSGEWCNHIKLVEWSTGSDVWCGWLDYLKWLQAGVIYLPEVLSDWGDWSVWNDIRRLIVLPGVDITSVDYSAWSGIRYDWLFYLKRCTERVVRQRKDTWRVSNRLKQ